MTWRNQRGSVTLVAAGAIAMMLVCILGIADVGRALAERDRAQGAADAAALAAAQDLALDSGDAAADAASFAQRNGAVLVRCSCEDGTFEAVVTVRRTFSGLQLLPGTHDVEATARAVVDT